MLMAPLAALAQQTPFDGLPPATPQDEQTNTTSRNAVTNNDGLETWQGGLIVLGGLSLLVGIGLAIARDARERAPADEEHAEQHDADAHKHSKQSKERQRQKQKSARAARRRNR